MKLLVSLWKMFCYAAGTAVVGLAIYEFWFLAQILYWVEHNPATTNVMDSRLDALRQKDPKASLEQKWIPYHRISNELKRAIIIAEDAKFVDDDGSLQLIRDPMIGYPFLLEAGFRVLLPQRIQA